MAFRAPLLGYNTNVRHKGKLYHIQTEDSGIDHPHVITHLFADGGRIVASKKTGYAERVGQEGLQDTVKKLMQGQHKAMFIALRDGVYDEQEPATDGSDVQTGTHKVVAPKLPDLTPSEVVALPEPTGSIMLPREATPAAPATSAAAVAGPAAPAAPSAPAGQANASTTAIPAPVAAVERAAEASAKHPASEPAAKRPSSPRSSLFGGDLLSDKSLDEVILNYLAASEKDG